MMTVHDLQGYARLDSCRLVDSCDDMATGGSDLRFNIVGDCSAGGLWLFS